MPLPRNARAPRPDCRPQPGSPDSRRPEATGRVVPDASPTTSRHPFAAPQQVGASTDSKAWPLPSSGIPPH